MYNLLLGYVRRLKAARHVWVDQPLWDANDAAMLTRFLETEAGAKFKVYLRNYCLRQNAMGVSSVSNLQYACGESSGAAKLVATIESLADEKNFTGDGEDTDHSTS